MDKLQRIQNTAACLVMGLKSSDHVTPILKNLHWLTVEKRIEFTENEIKLKGNTQNKVQTIKWFCGLYDGCNDQRAY